MAEVTKLSIEELRRLHDRLALSVDFTVAPPPPPPSPVEGINAERFKELADTEEPWDLPRVVPHFVKHSLTHTTLPIECMLLMAAPAIVLAWLVVGVIMFCN